MTARSDGMDPAASESDAAPSPDAIADATIRNKRGLHARAAASFVKRADQFDADVTVRKDELAVPGRSIMGLMMLGAGIGSVIEISATGAEAGAAVASLVALVEAGFDED